MGARKKPLFHQGVHSFKNFEEYHRKWLIPSMLGDLETIFQGTTICWKAKPTRARGNFALATTLMAAMDHVGSFLRKPGEPIHNALNISLCARLLRTTYDVHRIIAYAGRNTLIHETWPATMLVINDKDRVMRLGLNINANEDTSIQNRILYRRREYYEPLDQKREAKDVVKLRVNVYSIFEDFRDLILNWPVEVSHQAFREVQEHCGSLCYFNVVIPQGKNREMLHNKIKRQDYNEWRFALLKEIRYVYDMAPKPRKNALTTRKKITLPYPEPDFREKLLMNRKISDLDVS